MTKKTLMLALGLTFLTGQVKADNISSQSLRVWMDDITITADGTTATRLWVYEYDAERDYTAFNMSLIVPEGITVAQVEDDRDMVNSINLSERATKTHTITCNMPEATLLKIMCSSSQNKALYPDDKNHNIMEKLFYVDLIADPSMQNGTYTITTGDIVFAYNDGATTTGYVPAESPSFQITISGGVDATVPYTLSSAGVGTLCLPFDAEVPEGLTVHKATAVVGNAVQLEAQTSIAAGVPLIVTGTPGNYSFQGAPTATGTEFTEGVLTGVTESRELSEGYVLQTLNGVTGFYRVDADNPVTMPAYRAYLNYNESAVKMLRLDWNTAINGVAGQGVSDEWYDLEGRRTTPSHRGVYVQQGTKRVKK